MLHRRSICKVSLWLQNDVCRRTDSHETRIPSQTTVTCLFGPSYDWSKQSQGSKVYVELELSSQAQGLVPPLAAYPMMMSSILP